ncbi:CocE/NonD family hydrolase [Mucilaginibacter flavidus]|uniref:CocE/NonD family hydrolase n=1 Tax=Mucilaginibacter flavidus TaxID=2949309 RepID=UPI00209396B5|nr:CocE/NonD family hydrolase [Mucilaginibacter flavidus]MCO5947728.1 CocE/NonD family hydrolase [Mucilaginibacter flavidus]
MNRKLCMALLCLIISAFSRAQNVYFPQINSTDSIAIAKQMQVLANEVINQYQTNDDKKAHLDNLFKLQIIAGKYTEALNSIAALRQIAKTDGTQYPTVLYAQYELFCQAELAKQTNGIPFKQSFYGLAGDFFRTLDDKSAVSLSFSFTSRSGISDLKSDFKSGLVKQQQKDSLDIKDAIELCKTYNLMHVLENIEPLSKTIQKADDNRRYIIQDSVFIKAKNGVVLSAVVVRKKGINIPQPAVMLFFIYSNLERSLYEAKNAAARGYVGIVADTRGKRLSPGPIEPYEHENEDVNTVINWIAAQPWSNGKVGMYGGSYSGFAQWAATKHMNKALKTIVPYVAAIPGQGVPMENNIFLNVNYQWAFYVTNNKYTDDAVNNDNQRWNNLRNNWYNSGAAFNKIDSIDGTPNPWLQKWLKHPSFDKYWQAMVPYKTDFAKINIPVLTFEGYYDDGQISGMQYLLDHYKYNPKANHYLIIGPYDHFGTQQGGTAVLRDYHLDPVAPMHTRDITFEWFDYILKGRKKPAILKDKINYEVMGANVWQHAPSLDKMYNSTLKLYLTNIKADSNYLMVDKKPVKPASLYQEVNLADRTTSNNDYYPDPIIKKRLDRSNGLFFISKPFDKPIQVNGIFTGELKAIINKKDMDIGVVLYEVMPNGDCFELSYYLGRASYAKDASVRRLLHPGVKETISFTRTRMVSKRLSKGSRLLVVLNIDKNPFAQVNYGTGKDVSEETIKDAGGPLKIWWGNDSFINVPVMR